MKIIIFNTTAHAVTTAIFTTTTAFGTTTESIEFKVFAHSNNNNNNNNSIQFFILTC
jgi:hypothetical protein